MQPISANFFTAIGKSEKGLFYVVDKTDHLSSATASDPAAFYGDRRSHVCGTIADLVATIVAQYWLFLRCADRSLQRIKWFWGILYDIECCNRRWMKKNIRIPCFPISSGIARSILLTLPQASFRDGMDLVDDYHGGFDILLMDIKMKHLDGMKAARKIRSMDQAVVIIFITTMAQYAVAGYEVDALDLS